MTVAEAASINLWHSFRDQSLVKGCQPNGNLRLQLQRKNNNKSNNKNRNKCVAYMQAPVSVVGKLLGAWLCDSCLCAPFPTACCLFLRSLFLVSLCLSLLSLALSLFSLQLPYLFHFVFYINASIVVAAVVALTF